MSIKPKKREGVTCYLDQTIRKQLKQLALDLNTSVTALIGEAINDLFVKKERENKSK